MHVVGAYWILVMSKYSHFLKVTCSFFLFTRSAGTHGSAITLKSNYFKFTDMTDWCVYQYRVDFAPEEDRTFVRKGLVKLHRKTIGAYIFDGTVLYTSNRLPEVSDADDFVFTFSIICNKSNRFILENGVPVNPTIG